MPSAFDAGQGGGGACLSGGGVLWQSVGVGVMVWMKKNMDRMDWMDRMDRRDPMDPVDRRDSGCGGAGGMDKAGIDGPDGQNGPWNMDNMVSRIAQAGCPMARGKRRFRMHPQPCQTPRPPSMSGPSGPFSPFSPCPCGVAPVPLFPLSGRPAPTGPARVARTDYFSPMEGNP